MRTLHVQFSLGLLRDSLLNKNITTKSPDHSCIYDGIVAFRVKEKLGPSGQGDKAQQLRNHLHGAKLGVILRNRDSTLPLISDAFELCVLRGLNSRKNTTELLRTHGM